MFFLDELTQIEWSISQTQNNGRDYERKIEDKKDILIIVLNLIQMQNLDLSDYLLIDNPNLKNFLLFILHYTKRK